MHISTAGTFLAIASQGACWGGLGHRTVGYLAQKYFTDEAVQFFNETISPNQHFDISDAAVVSPLLVEVWADSIRYRRHYTAGWHFIDAKDKPPQQCNVNFSRDCKKDQGCVISAISNHTNILLNPESDRHARNEALKFVIHFIGDTHQPLHTEDLDRGGNDINVCFDSHCGQRENLHGVWDTAIPRKMNGLSQDAKASDEKPVALKWADALAESAAGRGLTPEKFMNGCTGLSDPDSCGIIWATEANALVCSYVLYPGLDWIEHNDLGGEYYQGAVPIVELQIVRAGMRLAAWINAIAAASVESARDVGVHKSDL